MKQIIFSSSQKTPLYAYQRNDNTNFRFLYNLYSAELQSLSPKRIKDFLAGRYAAHYAVKNIYPDRSVSKILRSETGSPIFPDYLQGSIAHSDHYACAFVAPASEVKCVGIDVETIFSKETYSKVKSLVFTKNEIVHIDNSDAPLLMSTLIFSAKESLYKFLSKYLSHKSKRFIDFLEVEIIDINLRDKSYTFEIGNDRISGHFHVSDNSIFTIISLEI